MTMTRRDFVKQAGVASAALPAIAQAQAPRPCRRRKRSNPLPVRVGMTDWNLGQRGDITKIALAREIGLDGIQVSVQYPTDGKSPTLRDPKTQAAFQRAALENGIQICSLAIGNPGKSTAADAHQPGVRDPAGRGRRDRPQPRHQQHPAADPGRQPHRHDEPGAGRHVRRDDEGSRALRGEIRRRRRPRGLDFGRRTTSGSSTRSGRITSPSTTTRTTSSSRVQDIYAEPKMLGKRISQIHVKNANMLLSTPGGKIDWPRMAKEFYDIGYRGWYVLETDSPTKDIVADTRANIEYVKKTFRMPLGEFG